MNITINQITPRRENGEITSINVHFTARTGDGNINLNGTIPINSTIDFDAIETELKQELVNNITGGE